MNIDLRTLLRDIKAAARIGHPESVWAALEQVLEEPQIAGNHVLDATFTKQVILPVGQALAQPLLNHTILRPLVHHSHAGIRAIAGVTLVERVLKGLNANGLKELSTLAQDPRQDVRKAILLACTLPATHAPEKQTEIFEAWLGHSSPRLQGLALQLLPSLPEGVILAHLDQLENFSPAKEPGVRRALAEAVSRLGQGEYAPQVLGILASWAEHPAHYYWVLTRSLSRSWAARYPDESLAILTKLAESEGGRKRILRTLEALERHGAKAQVQAVLQAWSKSGNPQLQSAARKAHEKQQSKEQK